MLTDELKKIIEAHQRWLSGDADLSRANLRDADLSRANLCGADLRRANLRDANLCGADLRDADLRDADLRDADLCGADLSRADLSRANLCGADLRDADLRDADLSGANLCGADLRDAKQKIISIKGSQHQIVAIDDDVRIGCQRFPLKAWLNHYPKIGAANNYSEVEAKEYGIYLKAIKQVLLLRAGDLRS